VAQWLKQSTATTIKMGPFCDDTDGKTAETGLTIARANIRLTKNGGAFAQTHNSAGATHDENGYYGIPLDTTDTDTLGRLRVAISASGALPVWQDFIVVSANIFDSLVGGTDLLDTNLVQILGTALTETSGQIAAAFNQFFNVATPAGTVNAVKLASDGLDAVSISAPTGVASNFREMMVAVWRRFFKKATATSTQIKTYADDGTTALTTQTCSDDGTTQTQGTSA
jgi:hypothetical protein